MKLSDVVANAGLALWAEIALILFVIAFAAVLWRVFRPSSRAEHDRMSRLPLDDGAEPREEDR
jgi:cbb3-type cytochrome oxidase subunit 3